MEVPKLWTALLSGKYDLVNQIIERGGNVNELVIANPYLRMSLLHYAVLKKSDVRCIRVLANLGANFNVRDTWERTPLHWAVIYNAHPDVVEVLINEGALVNAWDDYQFTPLHYAPMKVHNMELVQKLIARGASIDANRELGVLHMAVIWHNLKMVEMLISHRVIIDAKNIHGCTPLLCYFIQHTKQGYIRNIIELLLDNGADVNAKSYPDGIFCLFLAAKYNHQGALHLLLKKGAHVNQATNYGNTALHVACQNGLAEVTALLLKFGADLNACNQESKTPFEHLPNSPSTEATAQIIISEAVKREALGQSLCEEYKQMAQSCETYWRFEQKCRDEVKRMQREKIDAEDSAISFFYIFSIDEELLVALARNEEIVTAFESSGYVASFSIYAGELTTKFEKAKKRARLSAPVVRKIAAYVKYGYINEE